MSDTLEVKIGASDAGLEATLKTVQAELASMEAKVKSGDLTFNELEKTMRRMGQVEGLEKKLKAIGDESSGTSPKVDELGRDLEKMGNRGNDAGDKSSMSLGKIGIAAGVAGVAVKAGMALAEGAMDAARAVADGFGQAIDLGGRLTDLSSRTGETSGSLLVLERAFTNTGVSSEAVGTSLNKMQKFMTDAAQGGAAQSEAMQRLGLTMGDLAGKTPTEQMAVFAQRISSIQDPAQRAEAAMSIFGKSGGELLPILNNFSGELEGARDQLGGLPGVMDRSAAAFDATGDSMAAINSKVMEFAAGFLEEALPALTTFTNALGGIDAAGWGQKAMDTIRSIADTLVGAFKNPLAAIEAWGLAYEAGYKSLGNGLVNAALTFTDFLMKSFQTNLPSAITGYVTSGLVDSTLTFSRYLTQALMTFSEGLSTLPGFEGMASKMFDALSSVNEGIIAQQLDNMGKTEAAAAKVVEEFGKAAEKTTVFKEDFFGAEESTARMNDKFSELAASGAATRESLTTAMVPVEEGAKKVTAEMQTQLDTTAKIKASKQDELAFELAMAEAKASGNKELVAALESQKEFNAELKKAIDAGMGEPEARAFAQQMVNAKNAADAIGNRSFVVTVATKVDDTRWKDLLASLAANADPKSVQVALQVTGKDNLNEAYKTLQDMEAINKNYQAAFTVIGAKSLEELKANLDGIPTESQRQLAMQITGEDNLKDAVYNLERFTNTHKANLLLESQGFERMDDFQNQLNGITGEKRTKLILEALGMDNLEEAKSALDAILANDGKSVNITANVDTAAAQYSITSLFDSANTTFANPIPLNLTGDQSIAAVRTSAEGNFVAPIALNLDGDRTIQDVRAAAEANFANPITLTMSGSQAANEVYSTVNAAFDAPVELGVNADTSTAQTEVATLGAPQTFTLSADTAEAQTQVSSLGAAQTLSLDADTTAAQAEVAKLSDPISVQIDSNQVQAAVASMQADISNSFTGGEGGPGGSGGTGGQGGQGGQGGDANADVSSVTTILNDWTDILLTIRDRLPIMALSPA
jgi:hypothetical protein